MEKEQKLNNTHHEDIVSVELIEFYRYFHEKIHNEAYSNFQRMQLGQLLRYVLDSFENKFSKFDRALFCRHTYIMTIENSIVMLQNDPLKIINSCNSMTDKGKHIIRKHIKACTTRVSNKFVYRKIYLWMKLILVFDRWNNINYQEYQHHMKIIDVMTNLSFSELSDSKFTDYLNFLMCNIENKKDLELVNKLIEYVSSLH